MLKNNARWDSWTLTINITEQKLRQYVKKYARFEIYFKDGRLFSKTNESKVALIPMSGKLFRMEELAYFRRQFKLDTDNEVELAILKDDGLSRRLIRGA